MNVMIEGGIDANQYS